MLVTLPKLSVELAVSLDLLRELVRGDAKLRALGQRVGIAKGYTIAEVEQIKAALAAKRAKRAPKATATGVA